MLLNNCHEGSCKYVTTARIHGNSQDISSAVQCTIILAREFGMFPYTLSCSVSVTGGLGNSYNFLAVAYVLE